MNKKASTITKTEDFLLWFIPVLDGFPRKHKFLIADRMLSLSLEILELLIEAYYTERTGKKALLKKTNIEIEKMRHFIRLSRNMKFISFQQYEKISYALDEIGRMNGAWLKSVA